ncbi:hypothetical protein ACLK17_02200 [Escherichia coli]
MPPFVKQSEDQLLITLWLTGEDPPQRIMLRTEHDNEEMSVSMHKQRSRRQPGVTAWRAAIDLSSGQPRRRTVSNCCGTIASVGLHRRASAECRRHDWSSLPSMYRISAHNRLRIRFFIRILPDRFARSLPREAERDHVYYHHAAGQEIILRDWDEPVTAQAGGSTFYGGDLDGIAKNCRI